MLRCLVLCGLLSSFIACSSSSGGSAGSSGSPAAGAGAGQSSAGRGAGGGAGANESGGAGGASAGAPNAASGAGGTSAGGTHAGGTSAGGTHTGGASAAGSAGANASGSAGTVGGSAGASATLSDVQEIFDAHCVICHDKSKGGLPTYPELSLIAGDSKAYLVNQPALETCGGTYVVPGAPDQSYLIEKVSNPNPCDGMRMPRPFEVLPAQPLSSAEIATLRSWISAGAE